MNTRQCSLNEPLWLEKESINHQKGHIFRHVLYKRMKAFNFTELTAETTRSNTDGWWFSYRPHDHLRLHLYSPLQLCEATWRVQKKGTLGGHNTCSRPSVNGTKMSEYGENNGGILLPRGCTRSCLKDSIGYKIVVSNVISNTQMPKKH